MPAKALNRIVIIVGRCGLIMVSYIKSNIYAGMGSRPAGSRPRPRPRPWVFEAEAKAKAMVLRGQGQGQGHGSLLKSRPRMDVSKVS